MSKQWSRPFLALLGWEMRRAILWAACGVGLLVAAALLDTSTALIDPQRTLVVNPLAFAIALIIAAGQMVGQASGDGRAFLMHRPLSSFSVFAGKTVAGLTLYFAVTGGMLGFAMFWSSIPGNMSLPYTSSYAIPFVIGIVNGVVAYFATIAAVTRHRRTILSRLLPMIGAVMIAIIASTQPTAGADLTVAIPAIALMAAAAEAGLRTDGEFAAQGPLGRIFTASSIVPGAVAIALVLAAVTRASVTVDRATMPKDPPPRVDTIHGSIVQEAASRNFTGMHVSSDLGIGAFRSRSTYAWEQGVRMGDTMFVYLRYTKAIALFNFRSKLVVGWITPDGYHSGAALPPSRFPSRACQPSSGREPMLVACDSGIYIVDPHQLTIARIFTPRPDESVLAWLPYSGNTWYDANGTHHQPSIPDVRVFLTTSRVVAQSLTTGLTVFDLPLDSTAASVAVGEAMFGDQPTLSIHVAPRYSPTHAISVRRFMVTPGGGNLIPLPPTTSAPYDVPESIPAVAAALAVVSLPLALEAYWVATAGSPWGFVSANVIPVWSMYVVALAMGLVALVGAHRAGRSPIEVAAWALLGLTTGAAGVFAMACALTWPARVECSSCHKRRLVSRDRCEHCGAAPARPHPDGTEVFEPLMPVPA